MSVYLRRNEVKPGVLVKAKSFWSGKPIPAVILSWFDADFVQVIDTEGEKCMMNAAYLEPCR